MVGASPRLACSNSWRLSSLNGPRERAGLGCLARKFLHYELASALLNLRGNPATYVEPLRDVIIGGELCGGSATARADALAAKPTLMGAGCSPAIRLSTVSAA